MTSLQSLGLLLGRILLATIFVIAGYSKIGNFAGTAAYVASKGLPLSQLSAAAAIAVELGAGLLLVIGLKTRWAALALAVFTASATYFFHNFWALPEARQAMESLMFQKNLAIIGGLLVLAIAGPGRLSVDKN